MRTVGRVTVLLNCLLLGDSLVADETEISSGAVRSAIEKSIPLLEKTAAGTSEHRGCFTCHGHAMPVVALVEAQRRGFAIDQKNLRSQLEHTVADLNRGKKRYQEGKGQGGGHTRAGYALWMLSEAGWKPDEITGVVSGYLVHDEKADHWRSTGNRPPTEVSSFTASYLALEGLDGFGTGKQKERIAERRKKVLAWLVRTKAKETEDRVFRLLALKQLGAEAETARAVVELRETQRKDGGWAQLPGEDQKSDPYATGSALFALHRGAALAPEHEVYRRGLKFLLNAQHDDGSWYVKSRSEPFQTYYESGYPHKKDQFISMAAGSWATLALLFAVEMEGELD